MTRCVFLTSCDFGCSNIWQPRLGTTLHRLMERMSMINCTEKKDAINHLTETIDINFWFHWFCQIAPQGNHHLPLFRPWNCELLNPCLKAMMSGFTSNQVGTIYISTFTEIKNVQEYSIISTHGGLYGNTHTHIYIYICFSLMCTKLHVCTVVCLRVCLCASIYVLTSFFVCLPLYVCFFCLSSYVCACA